MVAYGRYRFLNPYRSMITTDGLADSRGTCGRAAKGGSSGVFLRNFQQTLGTYPTTLKTHIFFIRCVLEYLGYVPLDGLLEFS